MMPKEIRIKRCVNSRRAKIKVTFFNPGVLYLRWRREIGGGNKKQLGLSKEDYG
jgi:hypothetical protein